MEKKIDKPGKRTPEIKNKTCTCAAYKIFPKLSKSLSQALSIRFEKLS
jgi:hypothetical protein